MTCIFCKIVNKEIPAKILYESNDYLAFYDINPKDKVHFLVIPKKHIPQYSDLTEKDCAWLGEYMYTIERAAEEIGLNHYKIQIHNGKESGQEIFHLHAHVLSH